MAKKSIRFQSQYKNETGRREGIDRRQSQQPVALERRKVQRRRQIDPTTCERDYSSDEIEFMHALDEYKRQNGRMFPTCSEILEVIKKLGYRKTSADAVAFSGIAGDFTAADAIEQPMA